MPAEAVVGSREEDEGTEEGMEEEKGMMERRWRWGRTEMRSSGRRGTSTLTDSPAHRRRRSQRLRRRHRDRPRGEARTERYQRREG
eukprot:2771204-Rhodomonas_salina.1